MKGTFISADFVEDSNGNVKFLELNTDTAGSKSFLSQSGIWDNLITLISGSDLTGLPIDEFHVVFKPAVHQDIIDNLSQSLAENSPHITSFVEHTEELETIYPVTLDDADNKFILRLAYDENAILDSLYCKDGTKSLLLFDENSDLDSCVPYYYSSSEVVVNSLEPTLNNGNLPDFSRKSSNTLESVKFFKAGPYLSGSTYVSSSEFDSQRVADFTSSLTPDGTSYIMNYLQPSETSTDNAVSSIRTYQIVYGASLSTVNLGGVRQYAPLTLPSGSQIDWNGNTETVVELGKEHYHEFSTSALKEHGFKRPGTFETEKLISSSGDALDVDFIYNNYSGSNIQLKTYFISGSPDTDNPSEYLQWYHVGNQLPSGSYVTSSIVQSVAKIEMEDFTLSALKVDGNDSVQYVSPSSNLLVYESSSNETKFLPVKSININDPAGYYSYNTDGTLQKIVENEYVVLQSGTTGSFYSTDVESFDYYFVGDLGTVAMGLHNACFPAGTKISLSNIDSKNIEDIVSGDSILSYNQETDEYENSIVGEVSSHEVKEVVRITFHNGETVTCTPEHPFYVFNKEYQMAKNLEAGFETRTSIGETYRITNVETLQEAHTVYNLHNVGENENFFANKVLVHNKQK